MIPHPAEKEGTMPREVKEGVRQFWQGTVSSVYDGHEAPEIEMALDVWYTLGWSTDTPVTVGYPPPPLPRKGQTYWLIDDETFQKVKNLPLEEDQQ